MIPENKISEMIKALNGFEEYVREEVTMEDQIKNFLKNHPASALMELVTRVLYEKESET